MYESEQKDVLYVQDNCGNTLLHKALIYGDYKISKFLIEKGENLSAKNNAGTTPKEIIKEMKYNGIFSNVEALDLERSLNKKMQSKSVSL